MKKLSCISTAVFPPDTESSSGGLHHQSGLFFFFLSQETFSLLTAKEAQEVTFPMAPLKLPTKAPCISPNRMHRLLWHVITVITPVLLLLCVGKIWPYIPKQPHWVAKQTHCCRYEQEELQYLDSILRLTSRWAPCSHVAGCCRKERL